MTFLARQEVTVGPARVRLEALPRAPDDALEIVRAFRADLDQVVSPIAELADRLIEALQRQARQG